MKKKALLISLAALLVILVLLVIIIPLTASTSNSEPRRIFLPEDTTHEALVDTLQANGILNEGLNTTVFNFQFSILKSKVRPGSYVVEPHVKELSLVRHLRNGMQTPLRLTIGKFRTPQQLNEHLNNKLMHNDFNIPLNSFHLILPDTYEVYWTINPEQFMQRMEDEYNRFWTTEVGPQGELRCDLLELSDNGNARLETMILASIVDEETNNNGEKPLIASVYLNRLRRGMPLQADPTVKYAVGDFTLRRILNKHLATESPFNTYLHAGLPPAPICLPSKASIDAVLQAPETGYLYFCASEQLDGTHRFATTLDEHNQNAKKYHRAISALGKN